MSSSNDADPLAEDDDDNKENAGTSSSTAGAAEQVDDDDDEEERARKRQRLQELDEYLTSCILEDDVAGIQQCIAEGADVHFVDDQSLTPVHKAAYKGSLKALKYLVEEHGANVNVVNEEGDSPLALSLWEMELPVIQYLLEECHVDPRKQRIPPLCIAVQLLPQRALPIVQYLVEQAKVDVEAVDTHENVGCTPLLLCRGVGGASVVQYLVTKAGANVHVVHPQDHGNTPLHIACEANVPDKERIQCLLEAGANPSAINHEGNTPLFLLCLSDGTPRELWDDDEPVVEDRMLSMAKLLIQHGGTDMIHRANPQGQTALHNCAFYNSLAVIQYFVEEHGANINVVDKEGWTPLLRVFGGINEKATEMIDYLVNKAGADVLVRNEQGDTCLQQCQEHNQPDEAFRVVCEKTIPLIKNEDRRSYFGPLLMDAALSSPTTLEYLVDHALGDKTQELRDTEDDIGDTVLHRIMRNRYWGHKNLCNAAKCLVERGKVRWQVTNQDGMTARQLAEEKGHSEVAKFLKELEQ